MTTCGPVIINKLASADEKAAGTRNAKQYPLGVHTRQLLDSYAYATSPTRSPGPRGRGEQAGHERFEKSASAAAGATYRRRA